MFPRAIPACASANDTAQSDAALMSELLLGRPRAWREFHARYDRLIYRCIAKVTARFALRMNGDAVADIYATLLVQICSNDMAKLRAFDADRGKRLSSWIGLLAVNCAYDHLRAVRSEPRRASLEEVEEMDAESPQPDEVLDMKERAELVREILRDFSEKDREFVTLYFGEGLDVEQIAERMQISVKTVYSKKHKIQTRIEARLSELSLAA
jgi:RNA polymerase sigma-70 factor (ECF subfamily)